MRHHRLILTALIILSGFSSLGARAAGWKLQELARGSNALLVQMDVILAGKKSACSPSVAGMSELSQNLKILIDTRASELKNKQQQILSLLKNCSADCTCDTYSYALEKITGSEEPVVSASQSNSRSNSRSNSQSAVLLTSAQRLACTKRQPDFCKSKLLKALK